MSYRIAIRNGIGTVTSGAPATLTRSVIHKSSNANNAVSWGAGVKSIFIDCTSDVFHSQQAQLDNALARVKTTTFTAIRNIHDQMLIFCFAACALWVAAGLGVVRQLQDLPMRQKAAAAVVANTLKAGSLQLRSEPARL